MSIVDANIVLRYLLDDHPVLCEQAAAILERQTVTLPIEAACEVVYVLPKVYSVNRQQIRRLLTGLLNESLVSMEKPEIFIKALEYYDTSSLDFVDTLVCAYHFVEGRQVFSFDKRLNQFIEQAN